MLVLRRILITLGCLILLLLAGAGATYLARHELLRRYEELPPFTHSGGVQTDHRVQMPDGISLATTVYEPAGSGPWPTILIRNPYDQFMPVVVTWCERLVRYGYACVYQDVRGQGGSEGEWEPVVNEGVDGSETLHWLAKQPFVDGNIGMLGPSYLAAVQWAAASVSLPPEVKTFVPSVFTTNNYASQYEGGMFRHETYTAWAAIMAQRGMGGESAGEQYQRAIRHRPHLEVDELFFGTRLPWYREWTGSPFPDAALWRRKDNRRLLSAPERLGIPILMVGGWYDVFFGPQFGDWERLASQSQSRFIIGPWTHRGSGGDALETPNAGGGLLQWIPVLDWLGHHLRGEPLDEPPGVATYVMRENRWLNRSTWPPKSRAMKLHLSAAKKSASCGGGRLSDAPSSIAERVQFVYDPDHPVPTRGGSGMLAFILPGFGGTPAANVWQGSICARPDVLSFQTDALTEPLHLAGRVQVALTVASDAADTAFTAKLVEVFDDGRAVNIRDGITSLALRNGAAYPQAYEPGESVEVHIRFWPIEWVVPAGSRLRLDVSSSDFPKYHAHPNRAGIWSQHKDAKTARQSLLLGEGLAGWVELPIVAGSPLQ